MFTPCLFTVYCFSLASLKSSFDSQEEEINAKRLFQWQSQSNRVHLPEYSACYYEIHLVEY